MAAAALVLLSPLSAQHPASTAQELKRRLENVARAQQSGDPYAITETSKQVVALGLRQFANLRLAEEQFGAAAELASESLSFEDSVETRFLMATALSRAARNDEALKELTTITTREPKSAEAWDLLGHVAMAKKDYRLAVEALTKSNDMRPEIETSYTLAAALLQTKEVDRAAALFKRLVDGGGDPARMHIMAGRAYENAKLTDKAEAEYRAAIAANPKTSRGHYFLGLLMLTRNAWEVTPDAKKEFLAEVALNPEDFFGNYFMGCILSNEKSYDESNRYLKIAAAAKPDFPEPYLYMGLNAYGEQRYAAAEQHLRKSIKLTGTDLPRNNYQIRRAYFSLGRILIQTPATKEEGIDFVRRSKELEVKLLSESREQMLSMRDAAAEAVGGYDQNVPQQPPVSPAAAAAPLSTETWKALKMDSEQKFRAQGAESQMRQLLANAYNDLGTTSARIREFPLALSYFHDAERWNNAVPGLMRNLGLAAFLSSNYVECVRAMRASEEQQPLDPAAQSMLALALYSTDKYSDAVKAFEPVKDSVSNDPRMAYAYAVSLAKSGDKQSATAVLQKLRELNPPANVQVMIGQLYTEMGDRASAQSCFDKAKQLDPAVKLPK